MMLAAARLILAFVGGITILVGFGLIVTAGNRSAGLVTILIGGAVLLAVLYERSRYRSAEADLHNDRPGPGGGEPVGTLPAGFLGANGGLPRSSLRTPDAGLSPAGHG